MTSKLKTLASVIKVILRTNFSMFFSFTFTLVKEKRYAMTLMNSVKRYATKARFRRSAGDSEVRQ